MKKYLSLVKFSHTIFALPFAFIGLFLAFSHGNININFEKLLLVLLCMVTARNSAMAFNRIIDSKFDKQNSRTKNREIPSGKISVKSAIIFTIINSILFITATYFINQLCFYLSFITLFILLGYSYTKRFSFLCHIFLGLSLGLAPIGAYIAVSEQFNLIPVIISLAVMFWSSGFDIIYSLQDLSFDKNKKLHSIPSKFGKNKARIIALVFHLLTITLFVIIGMLSNFNYLYWVGSIIFAFLILRQHYIIRFNNLIKVNIAFFSLNGVASVVFAIFFVSDLIIL